MPSSNNVNIRGKQTIANALIPAEGPVALKSVLDFTGGKFSAQVDLTAQTMPPVQLSFVQGLYVDNSASALALNVTNLGTGQVLTVQPNAQAYLPVLASLPPIFNFNCAGNASPSCFVTVFFLNVPLPAIEFGATALAGGFTFNGGNLLVQDTAAENSLAALAALISAGALQVNNVGGGGGGGGFAGPLGALCVNINPGTLTSVLYTPAAGKKFYLNACHILLQPDSSRAPPQFVNWQLQDFDVPITNGPIAHGYIWIGAAPTLVPPTVGIPLFIQTDMGYQSTVTNGRLVLSLDTTFTGGMWCNFSIADK